MFAALLSDIDRGWLLRTAVAADADPSMGLSLARVLSTPSG